ncbi:polysaccharide biosynthesis protein [Clostridium tarantellae]|uniref:NAD-dependent epimerase/dehydratase family protein n=1 Tax=Clostridium tarantellae TaxID=39493 RepID=A0A6I1MUA1_9CLOT|nr:nucleoside-diphosphate sugar epimerase/dehydratase [Clostridium tarantellae]MPQ44431.1 NAD-dependent epimerase/dehydratase family protein [Clostridium tarantellae]
MPSKNIKNLINTLIIGAGECADILLKEIQKKKQSVYNIIGIIDDDEKKVNTFLNGFLVLGDRNDILSIVEVKSVDLIILAIPSLDSVEKKNILDICRKTSASIKVMPDLYELFNEKITLSKLRNIDYKDLLGREEIFLDINGIDKYIKDKVILITGGGGSIGSELCRQVARYSPKILLILDIYENGAYEVENELKRKYKALDLKVIIASVRDRIRLNFIFQEYRPSIVFHAAAHKHVPLMEFNIQEAVTNNVEGTLNLVEVSHKYNVDTFVMISTDKAVNPTNVMGVTKRICEMIVQAKNKESDTEFVSVRFGNVLGSNGSVIPLFKKQIEQGGPITLTDKEITRYFMLISEAVQLVIQAATFAKGGEIFVLDMGEPVKIYDLVKSLINFLSPDSHIEINIIGLRPGEKLYEELLLNKEDLIKTSNNKILIEQPEDLDFGQLKLNLKKLFVACNRSCNVEELKRKLKNFVPNYKYS